MAGSTVSHPFSGSGIDEANIDADSTVASLPCQLTGRSCNAHPGPGRWQLSDTVLCHLTAAIGGSARVSQSLSDLFEPTTTTTTSQLYHTSTSTLTTIAQFDTSLFLQPQV